MYTVLLACWGVVDVVEGLAVGVVLAVAGVLGVEVLPGIVLVVVGVDAGAPIVTETESSCSVSFCSFWTRASAIVYSSCLNLNSLGSPGYVHHLDQHFDSSAYDTRRPLQ